MYISYLDELTAAAGRIDAKGWAEGTGGNVSVLTEEPKGCKELKSFPLSFSAPELAGKCVLITRSGCRLANVPGDPERELALLRIEKNRAQLLWGLREGGRPSSELAAHLMSHAACLSRAPGHRAVVHTHATNVIAMGMLAEQDERSFTKALWSMCTECLMFLPDGVGVLPWMPCGTDEIGLRTAEKLREFPLVLWQNHGVFASGSTPDEAMGRVEIADKAAGLWLLTRNGQPRTITDGQLRRLAEALSITPRSGWL